MTPVPATTDVGPSAYAMNGVHGTCAGSGLPPALRFAGSLADCSSSQRSFWSSVEAASSACARWSGVLLVSIQGHDGAWADALPAVPSPTAVMAAASAATARAR